MDAVIGALEHERGTAGFSPPSGAELALPARRAERMELAKAVGLDPPLVESATLVGPLSPTFRARLRHPVRFARRNAPPPGQDSRVASESE